MIYCHGCGKQIHETAPTCPQCGAPQALQVKSAQRAQAASTGLSDAWTRRFALIEKAGGPKLPKMKELSFAERFQLIFNIWAFLFGPFYYAANGMWKKGLTLLGVCLVAVIILAIILEAIGISPDAAAFFAAGVFSRRSSTDFYKKMVLGDDGWW
ncbi:DUF2628 domain-containing protein [Rhodoferax ferrireducens]|uniref:DUF2628 domain-containing protein n=1 Tax=Rhodoferax ferrireducens TaxID=192843 RepID=UPI000E0D4521|nr:DUF2628 domain-containing protein [Rhodoferax ferrireducens]